MEKYFIFQSIKTSNCMENGTLHYVSCDFLVVLTRLSVMIATQLILFVKIRIQWPTIEVGKTNIVKKEGRKNELSKNYNGGII